jgi:dihydroxyacetone kinase-like predicted kinase
VTKSVAVVAVAPGDGLARTFTSAGASVVVRGGATANPSTEELLAGIEEAGANEVILLTNHKNVVLVARQAAALASGRNVAVIETRNAAEGIGALLVLDPRRDLEANATSMRERAAAIQTLAVTRAVRDARFSGRTVRIGETLVLDPDEGLVANGDDRLDTTLKGMAALRPGFEIVSIYTGLGVDEVEADELRERIGVLFPDIEVEIVDGGQPYYAYLIAAE